MVNLAPNRQRLENDVFTVGGIAQKYNCALRRLDSVSYTHLIFVLILDKSFGTFT